MTILEISELVGLIATGLGLVATIVAYVKKIISDIKTKKLYAFLDQKIIEAESKNISGVLKLSWVIQELYGEYGKDANDIVEQAKAYIEECIDFSKKVNSK